MSTAGRLTLEARAQRILNCRDWIAANVPLAEMSRRTNTKVTTLRRWLRYAGVITTRTQKGRPKAPSKMARISASADCWGIEESDASGLTEQQREGAAKMGITPGRMAWLLSCPCSGRAKGWRGGAAIG